MISIAYYSFSPFLSRFPFDQRNKLIQEPNLPFFVFIALFLFRFGQSNLSKKDVNSA
jgi:hypothetical protein